MGTIKISNAPVVTMGVFNSSLWFIGEEYMENWKEAFVYIKTEEDEKKWKSFLKEYFPNHYASALLSRDLVERPNKDGSIQSKRLGIGVNGYGWLSAMCLCKARSHYVQVKDFEEFKQTEIYKQIINNGLSYEVGEPRIISRNDH